MKLPIVIYTNEKGILSIKLPFIEDVTGWDNNATGLINGLNIEVVGIHHTGYMLAEELKAYLQGDITRFDNYPLVLHNATGFQKKVWANLSYIPYGKTISYQEFALRIGCPNAARAAGQALKINPWPILVPCHRVIGKDGGLRGFSSGIGWKKIILEIERKNTLSVMERINY